MSMPEPIYIRDSDIRFNYMVLLRTGKLHNATAVLGGIVYFKQKLEAAEEELAKQKTEVENRGKVISKQSAKIEDLEKKLRAFEEASNAKEFGDGSIKRVSKPVDGPKKGS